MDSSVTNTGGLMPSATISNSEGATMLLNDIPDPTQNVFLSRNVTDNLFEVQDQNLIESLSREVLLGTGTWQSGQAEISTTLTEQQLITNYEQPSIRQISLPDDIVKGSSFIASKLANIAYMRCDYELYLRVQGSPFLQGLLLLWNKMNADQTSKIRSSITEHLRSITSFPGVTLNMQSDSRSVKLVIPYTSEFQVFNPRNENKLNSVRLSILSALRGPSTSEKATYSIMGRMTNIKLYGHAPSIVSLSYPQTEGGDDATASQRGIVTQVADTVSSISNVVDGLGVPLLSSISKPIGWVSNVVSNVASIFGFSKDRDLSKVSPYENIPAKGFTHGVGFDYGVPLSLFPDNAIDPTIANPESIDEMSIQYLASRPYMLDRYTIKGGNTPSPSGTIVADIPISPVNYSLYGSIIRDYRTIFGAPVSLAVAMASWWRAKIHLNLQFAKTQYHQCRLLVQYLPYGSDVQSLENVLSQIIDISHVDESGIDLCFPSIFTNKWMRSYDPATEGYTAGCAPGRILISVLNPLISASTVNDDIVMMPWLTWENLELAEPGSLAKAAIGFDYPADAVGEKWTSRGLPVTGSSFNLFRDTTIVLGASTNISNLVLTNDDTGDDYQIVSTTPTGSYVSAVTCPQGTYTITHDGVDATIISNFPILGAGEGPSFQISTLRHGDKVTITGDPTKINISGVSFLAGTNSWKASLKDSSGTLLGRLEYDGTSFSSDSPVGLIPGEYNVELDPADSSAVVTIVANDSFGTAFLDTHGGGMDYAKSDSSSLVTTMGEQFRSLRMLTRRSSPTDVLTGTSVTLPGITIGTDSSLRQSVLNIISYMYRFTKGSISYKIIPKIKGDLYITTSSADNIELNSNAYSFDVNRALHYQNTALNPVVQVSLPYYCPSENLVIDSNSFPNLSNLVLTNLERSSNTYTVLVSAGDDHTFSQLAGCPAFTIGPSRSAA